MDLFPLFGDFGELRPWACLEARFCLAPSRIGSFNMETLGISRLVLEVDLWWNCVDSVCMAASIRDPWGFEDGHSWEVVANLFHCLCDLLAVVYRVCPFDAIA